jgi:serine O-acetyltransferase
MKKIAKKILQSIRETPVSASDLKHRLPKPDDINALTDLLRGILLFDYSCETACARDCAACGEAENKLTALLETARRTLLGAVKTALLYNNQPAGDDAVSALCDKYLETFADLRRLAVADIDAAFDGDPAADSKDLIALVYPGFYAVSVYRLAHALHTLTVPMLPRLMSEYAPGKTGIDIHPGANIGRRFFIDHGTGVVIGETTDIGDNVKLYQGVTLGALSLRKGQGLRGKKRHPTLRDNVTVYGNATILGGDTVIGENSTVGANAFITQSVPPGSKISGL